MDDARAWWAIGALTTALCTLLAIELRGRWRSRTARERARRAHEGERRAESLLEGLGYAIEARQRAGTLVLEVDGDRHEVPLRCDLVVRRGGLRYVAEVKTGARAPRLDHPPTRRQIVEYVIAFGVDGALLVDADTGRVKQIRLTRGPEARGGSASRWALALALWVLAVLALWSVVSR